MVSEDGRKWGALMSASLARTGGMTMIQVMAKHPDAKFVAICDKYVHLLDKCRKAAEDAGLKVALHTDFESFFNEDMDAVVLANYATEHAPFAIRLLNSGRHVVSEVLPVETLAEAVQLTEAVEASGKVYAYAENYCFFTATQEIKRLYRRGDIGEFMHGEGEYVHDCESIWPDITYGERLHWRNQSYSSYYCTHSIGPILMITGLRPVKVVGFETPNVDNMAKVGVRAGTSAMILMQMENGATVKSLQGHLKRLPESIWYSVYGQKGMMESDRWDSGVDRIYVYREGDIVASTATSYRPTLKVDPALAVLSGGHSGSDFYTMHYFLQKLLGREGGDECIDIYTALDMALPGLLAYRSILQGNAPFEVPNFRDKAVREQYRLDKKSTSPGAAPEDILPICSYDIKDIPDSVYDDVRKIWQKRNNK